MVIDNLYVRWSWRSVWPFEADPPSIVDANAELPFAITGQCLKTIAREGPEIAQGCSCFQPIQLETRRSLNPRERRNPFRAGEISGPLIAITDDHL